MIDSHCHLADQKFREDRDEVIARAKQAGVLQVITIADTLEEGKTCIEIAQQQENVSATVGVHPHRSNQWSKESKELLQELAQSSSKVVAIGEIGLDYHYMNFPKDMQQDVFRVQLHIAKKLNLPAIVHSREAIKDTWAIIREVQPQKLVLHCCTEKWEDVKRFVEAGYLLSFTGIATYPKSEDIRRTIKECPIEKLMIETDAPYLAPTPHRGKRNEPAYVVEVAKCIAGVKGISLEEIDELTTKNTINFFGIEKSPCHPEPDPKGKHSDCSNDY
ncbi:hypothetical protein COU77_02580 [Candidatus Peregrinibacteria bacterium CG10_big_fil_rev_8_21_14_0_10_49_16]|nr:MAG: hydrolase TatD [Candidatus Peregrinibacteria bacterium CG22_combo_CG10-13_8_21_14_all_49_11]PIR51927.1 MAG: hypothetical protein COU77_02580 [Candidatus Peregrinibacteria bacterium CG10_big_fil_rev_8_21_14_0_10_49_16]